MQSLFDENGKYIGLGEDNYLSENDIKDIQKAEKRKENAENALRKEIKHQEELYQKQQNNRGIKKKIENVTGITGYKNKKEQYKNRTIIENLGYRKEDKGTPSKFDLLLNKYCNQKQKMGIYIAIIVICFILVLIKWIGLV